MKKISLFLLVLCLLAFTACSRKASDAPNGMQTASNEYSDFNLYVPDNWIVETSTGVITAKYSDSVMANISMMALSLSNDITTIDAYWDSFKETFGQTFADWQEETTEDMLLDGVAAKKYIYTGTVASIEAKYMQVLCIRQGAVYIFTYTASPEKFDDYVNDVTKMLDTFTFK
ncbi:MAG: DUF1795 domain-containing protein [Clostridiales bacterium]|nr:DUF1795 domain-containing protein [Clostridiales bacterium]